MSFAVSFLSPHSHANENEESASQLRQLLCVRGHYLWGLIITTRWPRQIDSPGLSFALSWLGRIIFHPVPAPAPVGLPLGLRGGCGRIVMQRPPPRGILWALHKVIGNNLLIIKIFKRNSSILAIFGGRGRGCRINELYEDNQSWDALLCGDHPRRAWLVMGPRFMCEKFRVMGRWKIKVAHYNDNTVSWRQC